MDKWNEDSRKSEKHLEVSLGFIITWKKKGKRGEGGGGGGRYAQNLLTQKIERNCWKHDCAKRVRNVIVIDIVNITKISNNKEILKGEINDWC